MIYLDSAATTFQKPPSVARAMVEALNTMSSPGRGGHPLAMQAAETAFRCRSELAELFHVRSPEQVVLTMNATHALNIAVKSLVPPGGSAVISGYEHNAVTRPLAALEAKVSVADGPLFRPEAVTEAFEALVHPGVDAVICTHVSNVFGFVQPVEAVAAVCRRQGVPLMIDASQSAGILPLDLEALGAAYIAMPGHKGLYGPQGTGVLLCGRDAKPKPLMEGGTGSISLSQDMPDFLPDRLEAGTHNMPGIAGLLEGLRFVRRRTPEAIACRERQLAAEAVRRLKALPGVEVFTPANGLHPTGVVSFRAAGRDCEELAEALGRRGIALRAGLHCAPLAHESAGTLETGTLRASFSVFNREEEVETFLGAVEEVCRGKS